MDLYIAGQGKISLGQADFIAQGGEASVYARGDLAFKIYTDPKKMIPLAKIQELSVLGQSHFVRPQAILLDRKNRPMGYTMRRIQAAHVLCQLFNRAFRERKGITPAAMLALVRKLQEGVQQVHESGLLIVDLNEMNFLLDSAFQEVLFIDVDSYQTPGFPATALMESVRDRHATRFSPGTDWFSFGVVSFQMFIGIHPYKGRHATLLDLDARMQHNVSVLNPQVAVPKVCYPVSVIPPVYQDWFQAIFEDGQRVPPPFELRPIIRLALKEQGIDGGAGNRNAAQRAGMLPGGQPASCLSITELHRFPAEVVLAIPAAGTDAAVTTGGLYIGGKKHGLGSDVRIGFTPRLNHMIAGWIQGGKLELYDVTDGRSLPADIVAEALTVYEGRIYVKSGPHLNELEFIELPAGIRVALRPVGNVMENATQLFEGVAMQSLLGSYYASVFPRPGVCYSVRLQELDGYRVVDARFDGGVLMIVGMREGRYDQFILRFDEQFGSYDIRIIPDIVYSGLNFVVLDTGVCVHLNHDEELELFSNRKGSQSVRIIADATVRGGRLFKNGTQMLFSKGEILYRMTVIGR
jgi:hypothetical protein